MNPAEIINRKRDGKELSTEEVRGLIQDYIGGVCSDSQMAAFLMAVCFQGMTSSEVSALTGAYIDSGDTISWEDLDGPTVDKHSTGGIGDKVSLPLTAICAAAGAYVPMISGRGLGITGGTLDKLESIPGFQVELSDSALRKQLLDVKAVICGATGQLAPADKRIYALRDVTGTVASLPLIAASIMAKKVAGGADSLLLDVKTGRAAFMQDYDDSLALAREMVAIGKSFGVNTSAFITDMNRPLGRTAGNGIEVIESLSILQGNGPSQLTDMTLQFARHMLAGAGIAPEEADKALSSGAAYEKFCAMVSAQGGDLPAFLKTQPAYTVQVKASESGYVADIDALQVGEAVWKAGAGRTQPGGPVDYTAGAQWFVDLGDKVSAGDTLFEIFGAEQDRVKTGAVGLNTAVLLSDSAPTPADSLIYQQVD